LRAERLITVALGGASHHPMQLSGPKAERLDSYTVSTVRSLMVGKQEIIRGLLPSRTA
jgi:hypothetical protein